MTIELLRQNIARESEILHEILDMNSKKESPEISQDADQKKTIAGSINELVSQLKMINDAVPDLVNGIIFYPVLAPKEKEKKPSELVNIQYADKEKGPCSVHGKSWRP